MRDGDVYLCMICGKFEIAREREARLGMGWEAMYSEAASDGCDTENRHEDGKEE